MNNDMGLQLISPPPEESLPTPGAKRKRPLTASPEKPQPPTPNPRSRKQLKQRDTEPLESLLTLLNSHNPSSSRSRSTSAAPIPHYDPPTDVFTPPKEVFVTPLTATIRVSKSSKRKSTTAKKSINKRALTPIVVKLEMPDVDLNAPMPPPSPSDDPLLLSSSVEPSSPTPATTSSKSSWLGNPDSKSSRSRSPAPFQKLRFDCDFPSSSSFSPQHRLQQQDSIVEDQDLDITPPHIPFFGLLPNNPISPNHHDNGWSDSEGDDNDLSMFPPPVEGEGEFTGKWLEVVVKTKTDTPKSKPGPFVLSLERHPGPRIRNGEAFRDDNRVDDETGLEEEREEGNPFDFSGIPDEDLGSQPAVRNEEDARPEGEGPTIEDAFRCMGSEFVQEHEPELEVFVDASVEEEVREDSLPPLPTTPTLEEEEQQQEEGGQQRDLLGQDTSISISTSTSMSSSFATNTNINTSADTSSNSANIGINIGAEHASSNSSSRETSPDPESDIIKITSTDPRAAARAAAILKQHNYDCFTKKELLKRKRRYSDFVSRHFGGEGMIYSGVNGGGVLSGGIEKRRRKTVGGAVVRGEKVYFPGSPVVVTLGALLKEAEEEVSMCVGNGIGSPNPFLVGKDRVVYQTPAPSRSFLPLLPSTLKTSMMSALANKVNTSLVLTPKVPMTPGEMCYDPLTGERIWTKEEWKRLDACFTDERLEIAARRCHRGEEELQMDMDMAGADEVRIEDVVERFVEWMGGWRLVNEFGPDWSRESLESRTRALRSKQRKGMTAPPTAVPTPFSPPVSQFSQKMLPKLPFDLGNGEMDVPEFTPIRPRERLNVLQQKRWPLPLPPVATLSQPVLETSTPVSVPKPLLAPRYSHLLEEAKQISRIDREKEVEVEVEMSLSEENGSARIEESATVLESEDSPTTLIEEEERAFDLEESEQPELELASEPTTLGKRVKGLLFSYLPTLRRTSSKPTTTANKHKLKSGLAHPALPLPPQEVLTKPRGPVVTPAREPLPKPIHPKELVYLQQAPPIVPPASKIPRVVHPKQLVELNHVTPKVANGERQRKRKSSGASSVKDLIKGFETMEEESGRKMESEGGGMREVRRMRSVGEWRKDVPNRVLPGSAATSGRASGEGGRPVWKP